METHPLKMGSVKGLGLIALQESRLKKKKKKRVDILHDVIAISMLTKHFFNHTSFWHWTKKQTQIQNRKARLLCTAEIVSFV